MYKQRGNKRALVTRAGILMKNSNNIIWRMSTAATLLLRALQTEGGTLHTHYGGPARPLDVMIMALDPLLKQTQTRQTAEREGETSGPVLSIWLTHTRIWTGRLRVTCVTCDPRPFSGGAVSKGAWLRYGRPYIPPELQALMLPDRKA